jgi:hypothetical protein
LPKAAAANRGPGGDGIYAISSAGMSGALRGLAGKFIGDVDLQGRLTKMMRTFKIDHALDPDNKYLYHSFVESPDMMNIHNGNITTDENGDAVVEMPDYLDALNKDFPARIEFEGISRRKSAVTICTRKSSTNRKRKAFSGCATRR